MTPERYKQVSELYHLAREIEPGHRAAFLDQECGDDEALRLEVETLLASDEQAASFLASPAMEVAARKLAEERPLSRTGYKLGQYKILSLLGSGGMGEVYLSEDARLGRRVALKMLPAHFTEDEDRVRRFQREARAASALNHPNIVTIFDIGQVDSTHFLATEYIEGQTLRERMSGSPIPPRDAVDVAIQTASALRAAHEAGIIHRDIKPENIMLRPDGYVKVLDFGLAKLTEQRTESAGSDIPTIVKVDTDPGVVMGTASYMSPEQARGLAVDARTDIFSLGVVLYEMIAGQTPFSGTTTSDVISAVIGKEPLPLVRYAPDVPAELQWIVSKALRKQREDRYQTAKELLSDLRELIEQLELKSKIERSHPSEERNLPPVATGGNEALATDQQTATKTGAGAPSRTTSSAEYIVTEVRRHKLAVFVTLVVITLSIAGLAVYLRIEDTAAAIDSIAVLPFVNTSADTEYLSDGVTESLINRLSQLSTLRVVPRNTVFRYKGRELDAQAIGHDLKVRAVLMGRIVQRGDTLNIQTELIDVAKESQLWGEQYNRKLADIFSVQEEIAKQISDKLRLKLTGEEKKQLAKRYTENAEAYQLYLKGRYYAIKYTPEGVNKAIDYFNRAIAIDPNYALAYDGLAYCYYAAGWDNTAKEAGAKGRALAKRALEIDDTLAEAHTSLGIINTWFDYDWPAAETEFKRAFELNPNYASAHLWYGFLLLTLGRTDESIAESKRAVELDPLSPEANTGLGIYLFYARRYDEAMQQLRTTIQLEPNYWFAHLYLARVQERKGDFPTAIAELQKARFMDGAAPEVLSALGYAYAVSGKKEDAQRTLVELKEQSKRTYVWPYNIATVYAGLGERDKAFEYLEKEYAEGCYYLNYLEVDSELDSLRSDPRFANLRRRVGFAR